MKHKIITIAIAYIAMIALIGAASAIEARFELNETHTTQDPVQLRNGQSLSLDLVLTTIPEFDFGNQSNVTINKLFCVPPNSAPCNELTDINFNFTTSFVITSDPMRVPNAVNFTMHVPLNVLPGTRYPFNVFIELPESAPIAPALTVVLVGANISGMKFNDSDRDGINDGEPGLEGWNITLRNDTGAIIATAITDPDGKYQFTNLRGNFTVEEELQLPDWAQSAPPAGIHTVTNLDAEDMNNLDFGNFLREEPVVIRRPGKIVGWGIIGPKRNPDMIVTIWARDTGSEGIFGSVEVKDNTHPTVHTVKSTELLSVLTNKTVTPMTGKITGNAMVNDAGSYAFEVNIIDAADPSNGLDVFNISIPALGYSREGNLTMGDVSVVH